MEDKKTFGGYICRRRKELGMTQREFARKVYVTESAVSKWERGMSYPDITLVRDICEVLDITEHELLTASDDTEKCRQERLAEEYARTVRRCRHGLYVIFAAALTACAVVNLRTGGGWFLIAAALAAIMASLLLAPMLLNGTKLQPWRICISLGCAVVSTDLLFLACCAYSGPQWVPTLFPVLLTGGHLAAGLLLLPAILPQLPLTEAVRRHKALCYMAVNSILLFCHLAAAGCCLDRGWFPVPAVPLTLLGLAVPWILMAIVRYLPVNGWYKAACSSAFAAVCVWLGPWPAARTMGYSIYPPMQIPVDFSRWDGLNAVGNIIVLTVVGLGVLAVILGVKGAAYQKKACMK